MLGNEYTRKSLSCQAGLLTVIAPILFIGCSLQASQLPVQRLSGDSTAQAIKTTNPVSKEQMKKPDNNALEAISSLRFNGSRITASVISYGCTDSADFIIEHEIANGRCNISLVRTKPDLCKRAPLLADLSLEWSMPDDCADLELVVANPVLVTAGEGSIKKRFK